MVYKVHAISHSLLIAPASRKGFLHLPFYLKSAVSVSVGWHSISHSRGMSQKNVSLRGPQDENSGFGGPFDLAICAFPHFSCLLGPPVESLK